MAWTRAMSLAPVTGRVAPGPFADGPGVFWFRHRRLRLDFAGRGRHRGRPRADKDPHDRNAPQQVHDPETLRLDHGKIRASARRILRSEEKTSELQAQMRNQYAG